jgi:hypothetical protein
MKTRHTDAYRTDARATLEACRIPLGQDFFLLSTSQVEALLKYADAQRYQKPANANGSRARYFHDRLQRRAKNS